VGEDCRDSLDDDRISRIGICLLSNRMVTRNIGRRQRGLDMNDSIDKLSELVKPAVESAIAGYTAWFVINSICWLAFGLMCALTAIFMWRARKQFDDCVPAFVVIVVLIFTASLSVAFNLPTLLEPRAYAVHQLLKDASGSN